MGGRKRPGARRVVSNGLGTGSRHENETKDEDGGPGEERKTDDGL